MTETRFEIGKSYERPFVKSNPLKGNLFGSDWVPVIGPEHRDAEFVKFPGLHWHVDWRFATDRLFKRAKEWNWLRCEPSDVFNYVLQRWAHGAERKEDLTSPFVVTGEVVTRRVKCRREFPDYPYHRATWLRVMGEHYQNTKMKGMVCPHRGVPLEGCPRDGDVVTCPGHGLRWNVKTGELVTT